MSTSLPPPPEPDALSPTPDPDDGTRSVSSASVHRVVAVALGQLAAQRADALAELDRALEKRLGDLDRAVDARTTNIEAQLGKGEGELADALAKALNEFKRVGSEERRLLQEASAGQLAEVERSVRVHLSELEGAAEERLDALRELIGRVHDLEQAAASRIERLEGRVSG